MPLISAQSLIQAARKGNFALGYFESWNLESLAGVLDAAEKTQSPIILGFNGDFLSHPDRKARERLSLYAGLGKAAAEAATVPCALIFNECPRDEWVCEAVLQGFNLVMPADPSVPLEEYQTRTADIVKFAHARGAAVEAEVGELPCGATGKVQENGQMTDPEIAARFVAQTRVDLLAVSVGNVHIRIQGEQGLDLLRLEQLRRATDVPLVLHGGTGISSGDLQAAIRLGVVKVNYGTYLKQRYLGEIRRLIGSPQINPHELLGLGGDQDLMVAGRRAVEEAVLERIDLLGCVGKAKILGLS